MPLSEYGQPIRCFSVMAGKWIVRQRLKKDTVHLIESSLLHRLQCRRQATVLLAVTLCSSGEWGGFFREGDMERRWAEAFVDYLLSVGATDQFYWCMNPNSGKPVCTALFEASASRLSAVSAS